MLLECLVAASLCASDSAWVGATLQAPRPEPGVDAPVLEVLRQDYERLERNRSVIRTPLKIGDRVFERGLGAHSVGRIRIRSPRPIERIVGWVGVDRNDRTQGGQGSVTFTVSGGEREVFRSGILRGGDVPVAMDAKVEGAHTVDLVVDDAGDGPACDHADWADAAIVLEGGQRIWLDEIRAVPGFPEPRYPFSFRLKERDSDGLLPGWTRSSPRETVGVGGFGTERIPATSTSWLDPSTGLRVTWEVTRFPEVAAFDQVLRFENTGTVDTPLIEDVQALELVLSSSEAEAESESDGRSFLHRTNGAPSNPTDFEPTQVPLLPGKPIVLGGGGGRSSNRDLPFFKVECGAVSWIVAVGWSGQWQATIEGAAASSIRIRVGMERTRFVLHPGEAVRTPRVLVLRSSGDTLEANAAFRRLIHERYAARRRNAAGGFDPPLPVLFSNSCFTRGGGWLNECNASNQISLLRAYAPLGLEAFVTDAGWFEGGWPAGAGHWTPRRDAYPDGMGPVARAALESGMIYGLWFEPERVVAGTPIAREHPEWLLSDGSPSPGTYLLDMGNPAAREHFLEIIRSFMRLPGFRFYRQDFNMDPLPYWRASDAPDREGITEMRYLEGLYAYWDQIAAEWPDSLREECSSGGRRIDLETVMRMHVHQDSDYWFDDDVDQTQTWGLSQYLPNHCFTTPIVRLDDYTFHSTLATSLCVGWIADAPGFDAARAKRLLDRYRELRHLLVGSWYPLLESSRSKGVWMACQFHRPDLDEGMILAFRREDCPYPTVEVSLHGLDPVATYELTLESTDEKTTASGAELERGLRIELDDRRSSELIVYRRRMRDDR